MIHFIEGNLLESSAQALVNTVNTVGVMGKGIALQFKKNFPENYKSYVKACKDDALKIGSLHIVEEETLLQGKKIIINFPTKTHWKNPSDYEFIESGLKELVHYIKSNNIKSIAIPPLGTGNGGLDWNKVKIILEKYLSDLDCDIYIYQPNYHIKETLKKERVNLTPARAMLLSVLFDLVKNGEFVSEFASEKIAYFLQRFGAKDVFKLDFHPELYGPYSGKVKHVLYYLNGSYIFGYSSKDKKPFEELGLISDAEIDVEDYLKSQNNNEYLAVVQKTKNFLKGFYSYYGLELLSSVDYIMNENKTNSIEVITNQLENWNKRKKTLFTNPKFIKIAVEHISKNLA